MYRGVCVAPGRSWRADFDMLARFARISREMRPTTDSLNHARYPWQAGCVMSAIPTVQG